MLLLLPAIPLVLLFLVFRRDAKDWRDATLQAAVAWGALAVALAELTSLLGAFRRVGLGVGWALTSAGLLLLLRRRRSTSTEPAAEAGSSSRQLATRTWSTALVALVLALAAVAILQPPNTPDSMDYHLARAAHWIQNQSVEHYPTHNPKQLYMNPGAELITAQVLALGESDRWVGLVSLTAFALTLLGVSSLTKRLGGGPGAQVFAAVFCATLPTALLQAPSALVDPVAALWMTAFCCFALDSAEDGPRARSAIFVGLSLGLALLTKGTAYVFMLPFGTWWLIASFRNRGRRAWGLMAIALLVALGLNLGHYTRNLKVFEGPLGTAVHAETAFEAHPSVIVGRAAKHLSHNADIVRYLGLGWLITPTTGLTERTVELVHRAVGLDIEDPRTKGRASDRFYVHSMSRYVDTAGNPGHFVLIAIGLTLFVAITGLRTRHRAILYIGCLVARPPRSTACGSPGCPPGDAFSYRSSFWPLQSSPLP